MSSAGLPHSAISGSMRVCRSPELIAAYHGLPRLRVPRHPPHAFTRLTTTIWNQAELQRPSWFPTFRVTFVLCSLLNEIDVARQEFSNPRSTNTSVVK